MSVRASLIPQSKEQWENSEILETVWAKVNIFSRSLNDHKNDENDMESNPSEGDKQSEGNVPIDQIDKQLIEHYSTLSLFNVLGCLTPKNYKNLTITTEEERKEKLQRLREKMKAVNDAKIHFEAAEEKYENSLVSFKQRIEEDQNKQQKINSSDNKEMNGEVMGDDLLANRFKCEVSEIVNAIGSIFPFNKEDLDWKFELQQEMGKLMADLGKLVD